MAGFLRRRLAGARRLRRNTGAARAGPRRALRRLRAGARRRLLLAAIILRVAAFCAAVRLRAIGFFLRWRCGLRFARVTLRGLRGLTSNNLFATF